MLRDALRNHDPSLIGLSPMLRRVCAAVAILFIATGVSAETALIVLSSESGAYKAAAASCADRLRGEGWRTETIPLKTTDADTVRAGGYDAVVTLGASASATLAGKVGARVVYCLAPDPAALGLTAQSGVSGVSSEADVGERFRLVSAVLPKARNVGVLVRNRSARSKSLLDRIKRGLPAGWRIETVNLDEFGSVSGGIRALLSRDIDAAWMIPDPAVYDSSVVKALLLEAIRTKTPVVGFSTKLARSGALIGIGVDPVGVGTRAAEIVLSGSAGRHEQPVPVFALNAIVADRLGIDLPRKVKRKATEVYDGD